MHGHELRHAIERYAAQRRRETGTEDDDIATGALEALGLAVVGVYEELARIRRALEPTHEEHSPR